MDIHISLDLTKSYQKYLYVAYKFSNVAGEELNLSFPTWSPGSYLIREYESQVEGFVATDAQGRRLKHSKVTKCQWRIPTRGSTRIHLVYRVYAGDLNVRGVYADDRVVFINATSVFFYADLKLPVTLRLKVPRRWHVAIGKKSRGPWYFFSDFDELFDTPILCAGRMDFEAFTVLGTHYRLAFWGQHMGDTKKIARDLKAIVSRQVRIFKENPCRDYLFQVLFVPKQFGGLEHAHASTNFFDGSLIANERDYKRFLALLSHEHFHLWNGKRIRPRELGPFDYSKEIYTRELWMAEGITSFYDDHSLLRAGIYSEQDYLNIISENITKLEANKSVRVNSISESSFDAWIRFYRQNENAINTVVSYYLKGGLVMMLLDFRLIVATKARRCLDDVMLTLYRIYKRRPGLGFTREEFVQTVERLGRQSFRRFFTDHLDSVRPINWRREFAPFGIEVTIKKKQKNRYLGVILEQKEGKVVIKSIAEDSPAFDSVLQPGDEIIALERDRLESLEAFDRYLNRDQLHVVYARLGRVGETRIKLSGETRPHYEFKIKKKLTAVENRNLKKFFRR